MLFAGNVVFLVTGGVILALGWLLAALLCCFMPFTRPLVRCCLRLSCFCLWPGDKQICREGDLASYTYYVRTGQHPPRNRRTHRERLIRILQAIFWMPIGTVLFLGHVVHGGVMIVLVTLTPWTRPDFSLACSALLPREVTVSTARKLSFKFDAATSASQGAARRPPAARRLKLLAWIVVAFFCIPTVNQAFSPGTTGQNIPAKPRASRSLLTTGPDTSGQQGLSERSVIPVEWFPQRAIPPHSFDGDCLDVLDAPSWLSRREAEPGSLPLGSSQVRIGPYQTDLIRYAANPDRSRAALRATTYVKSANTGTCGADLARRVARAAPPTEPALGPRLTVGPIDFTARSQSAALQVLHDRFAAAKQGR